MCCSKFKLHKDSNIASTVAEINGRPVLQPPSNQITSSDKRNSLKKISSNSPALSAPLQLSNSRARAVKATMPSLSPPISPKSPRPTALKRGKDSNELNSSSEKVIAPRCNVKLDSTVKKPKNASGGGVALTSVDAKYSSSFMVLEAPGSIAAARREQVAMIQEQRKMRIAHYGRTKSAKYERKMVGLDSSAARTAARQAQRRCSFITVNSDPVYAAYHDEEWGVAVHDDQLLFELVVLIGAQVGSDWTSVLKKRQDFREAFSGFDAEVIAGFSEKNILSISSDYGIDVSQVRAAVDNANRILEVRKEFGSFNNYLWGFVNHKRIVTQYKSCHKIPVKTSKSEAISKDMVRRGFRFVGPTVIHSLMQAAGLTNDHLITCPRHLQCIALASQFPTVAPAL
ncbi:Methyladenine glycosylase - like 1 [Theobroma cacao]|nr:Methyladenine glycosylase - like 1 [Theobroma cacao]